ncbi:MAG: glycoside hydrolase family 3 N-terminal domain-containing protein [Jatrophihabitans sp.]|uniref:glycoside hydrolase family 3 N-terminal domain-containing protein n=1 Tax=Jatrophihabitans sp. TaxID=1932789 RepID=UPI003F80AC78
MTRRSALLVALTMTLAACGAPSATTGPQHTAAPNSAPTPTPTPTPRPSPARAGTAACIHERAWPTWRLAAQTVVVPAQETAVDAVRPAVAAGAGGVILFGSSAPTDLGRRLASLRAVAVGQVGLTVLTDEEGGGVQRMANLVGALPWPRNMARTWTTAQITSRVATVARRMAAAGVDTDLAPVVDVDGRDVPPSASDPDGWRSFGGSTAVVTRDGVAFARGLLRGGVTPVLKHFPGLGGATGNTDEGAARTLPWARLQGIGLPPFVAGIRAGAPAVMVANAVVPGLTRLPATLSPAAITGVLRGRLGFRGLVITDSLSAGAVSAAGFGVPRAAVRAIRSGADLVLYSAGTPAAAIAMFRRVVAAETAAVARGSLTRARLVAAARTVLSTRHANLCP